MKPANDELYELTESVKDWFFSVCVIVGAATAFVVALAVTL